MATVVDALQLEQLLDRRQKLQAAATAFDWNPELSRLLDEVDAALARMEAGTYGLCETCYETIEPERLLADPLVRFCLAHLTAVQQHALEEDLQLAVQIQRGLLPAQDQDFGAWQVSYIYEPAGLVSGDYCDLIKTEDALYFILGDVSGKGVAASLLMANLQAMFRALVPTGLSLDKLTERASRLFCESTLSTHFATLVCGRASANGEVELCNAGHLPPILLQHGAAVRLDSGGLPVGIFCDEKFSVERVQLVPGDALLLYTDGITETQDSSGVEYGIERLLKAVNSYLPPSSEEIVQMCLNDLNDFRGRTAKNDDVTMMAIRLLGMEGGAGKSKCSP